MNNAILPLIRHIKALFVFQNEVGGIYKYFSKFLRKSLLGTGNECMDLTRHRQRLSS